MDYMMQNMPAPGDMGAAPGAPADMPGAPGAPTSAPGAGAGPDMGAFMDYFKAEVGPMVKSALNEMMLNDAVPIDAAIIESVGNWIQE
jgi:hypothetical protein